MCEPTVAMLETPSRPGAMRAQLVADASRRGRADEDPVDAIEHPMRALGRRVAPTRTIRCGTVGEPGGRHSGCVIAACPPDVDPSLRRGVAERSGSPRR